jgi:hypothetical protein
VNLIGPEATAVDEHIAEVAVAADPKPEREVMDFGSGGGLPAIRWRCQRRSSMGRGSIFVEADQVGVLTLRVMRLELPDLR